MPKKSAASSREGTTALATLLLGGKARVSALASVSLDLLLRRTREELTEAARRLGLSGPGRLRKQDLARRIHEALRRSVPAGRAGKAAPSSPHAPRARPS